MAYGSQIFLYIRKHVLMVRNGKRFIVKEENIRFMSYEHILEYIQKYAIFITGMFCPWPFFLNHGFRFS